MNLPRHLRYLLDAEPGELSDYFPETAAGTLRAGAHEDLFCPIAGLCYVGDTDGTMVPVEAGNLEEIDGNTFDPVKFSTLVHAINDGHDVVLQPGYADLFLEDGELTAQVRDGNHRTFAALGAGATFSWVMISDNTKQYLDEGLNDKLYKAIRAAQKEYGVPLLKRRGVSRLKGGSKALKALQKAEREYIDARQAVHEYHQEMLRRFGKAATPHDLEEQLERPQIFWRIRLNELAEEKGRDWVEKIHYNLKESKLANRLQEQIGELNLYDLRKAAGLNPTREKLDPDTMKVVPQ